jgi:hypothetical protein
MGVIGEERGEYRELGDIGAKFAGKYIKIKNLLKKDLKMMKLYGMINNVDGSILPLWAFSLINDKTKVKLKNGEKIIGKYKDMGDCDDSVRSHGESSACTDPCDGTYPGWHVQDGQSGKRVL